MNRRTFLSLSVPALVASYGTDVGAGGVAPMATASPTESDPKRMLRKGIVLNSLRSETARRTPLAERFQWLCAAGFSGVEVSGALDTAEVLAAQDRTGLAVPTVIASAHWTHPLTSPSPEVRAEGRESVHKALQKAKIYNADTVLLVPGVVTREVAYDQALRRSAAELSLLLPRAESLGIVIALENVWNQFLLSPLEAVAFVDRFNSPFLRWYFDVGNVVAMGFPEQWVRILGSRIARVHVKGYSRSLAERSGPSAGFDAELLDGDVDWEAVMVALKTIGYSGWIVSEQRQSPDPDTRQWLQRLSQQMDYVLASQRPSSR